eukprot:2456906-Alexandrium_andersonii.AAC.1
MQPPPPPSPQTAVDGAPANAEPGPARGPHSLEVPQHPDFGRSVHFEVWRTVPETQIIVTAPLICRLQD